MLFVFLGARQLPLPSPCPVRVSCGCKEEPREVPWATLVSFLPFSWPLPWPRAGCHSIFLQDPGILQLLAEVGNWAKPVNSGAEREPRGFWSVHCCLPKPRYGGCRKQLVSAQELAQRGIQSQLLERLIVSFDPRSWELGFLGARWEREGTD